MIKNTPFALENILWLLFDKGYRLATGFLITVAVAKYLGPAQYGLMGYALTIVSVLGVISSCGMNTVVTRELVRKERECNEILSASMTIQFSIGVALYLLISTYVFVFEEIDANKKAAILIVSTILVFKCVEPIKYWFEAKVRLKYVVWVENIAFTMSAALKLICIYAEAPFEWFLVLSTFEILLGSLLLLLAYRKINSSASIEIPRLKEIFYIINSTWPALIANISHIAIMKFDVIILEHERGVESVGIYMFGTLFASVWYVLPAAIISTFYPKMEEARRESIHSYKSIIEKLNRMLVGLAIGSMVIVVVASEVVINLLGMHKYNESALIMQIYSIGSIFVFLNSITGKYLVSENLINISMWRYLGALLVNISANLILVPMYGPMGAAIAAVLSAFTYGYIANAFHTKTRWLFESQTRSILTFGMR